MRCVFDGTVVSIRVGLLSHFLRAAGTLSGKLPQLTQVSSLLGSFRKHRASSSSDMDIQRLLLGNVIMGDKLAQFGSVITTIVFAWALYQQYIPYQLRQTIDQCQSRFSRKFFNFLSPYLDITFDEYTGDRFKRSEVYTHIQVYLSERSSTKARRLKANSLKGGKSLVLGIADNEEVSDEYEGVKVRWTSYQKSSKSNNISFYPGQDERRYYQLRCHRRHTDLIIGSYLSHVIEQGQEIAVRNRQRKLFTNAKDTSGSRGGRQSMWSHIEFKHPATFRTIAMEATKKQRIIDDLTRFRNAKDYYVQIGKPWKRGYLLYGPPGTGKSTMIAAIANFLEYDVYDLELTAVDDNVQLRRLLIETSSKSIIVIEDIDCSLDLTGQRQDKMKVDDDKSDGEGDQIVKKLKENKKKGSEVTLSGLLNFIDGIWSACGEERLIVFTTNYLDKLDPALIRRGRMDMHIELSYCSFEAFKVLAKNYLGLDSHPLFDTIETMLQETDMAPADVAENLMPKSTNIDVDECLQSLVLELETKAKEDAKLRAAEEEKRLKAVEEEIKSKEIANEKKDPPAVAANGIKVEGDAEGSSDEVDGGG